MTDPESWIWDYAFDAEDQMSFPKIVQDEVKALADQIAELANLGIDPNTLGEGPLEAHVGTASRAVAGSRCRPFRARSPGSCLSC